MTRRRVTAAPVLAAALAALAALPDRAAAEPLPIEARVVWTRADRVYIAAADSIALAPGDLVTFIHRRKEVASGVVEQVPARDFAAARLGAGSLERISRLDRVSVLAERRPLPRRRLLRIGYPGRGRGNLLFECARPSPRALFGGEAYRADSLAVNAYRLVRASAAAGPVPWPDTVMVRLFREADDEEIALERGELDVAVFWPGEPSSRLRSDPVWRDLPYGSRSRGVLAAVVTSVTGRAAPAAALAPDDPVLAALNQELFRGDLAPWREPAGWPPRAPASSGTPGASPSDPGAPGPPPAGSPRAAGPLRFVVDPSCPGKLAIERFLERASRVAGARDTATEARLFYVEAPVLAPDSLAGAVLRSLRGASLPPGVRARADSLALEFERRSARADPEAAWRRVRDLHETLGVTLLFTVRCPLAVETRLRPLVEALGPGAIADLLDCAPAGGAP